MTSTACEMQICGDSADPSSALIEIKVAENDSYAQILKSSALIGGSQLLNIGIGIVRTKAMAMFLGPAGFGLAGLYNSVAEFTQNVAGMGVNSSGVRQIAEAVATGDQQRIGLTVTVLRRTSLLLGTLGLLLLVVFSRQVSRLTFGTEQHATAISILSIAVFCKLVSGGQTALIQGMRRIVDLAKLNVIGAIAGAGIGIGLVYVFRENGIVPYLVAVAATTIFSSWWYSRRIRVPSQPVTVSQIGREARALLRLGVAFMISSMMTLGVAYAVRVAVLHKLGFEATGLYQCAWTLGGLYVGFILQAMAADFYPRLTGSINDHPIANRLVNEQARVGLLLAGPGVIGTLTFAPIVIALLYSSRFNSAVPTLRWVCLGATLQVVTWPMGFIIVAKGRQNLFIFAEVAWAVASLVLAWVGISLFGVTGAGIAFFASYVFHAVLVYPIARHLSGFRWSRENIRTGLLFLSLIALVFWTSQALPPLWGQLAGAVAAICAGVYSIRVLNRVVNTEELPRVVRRLLGVLRLHGEAQKAQS